MNSRHFLTAIGMGTTLLFAGAHASAQTTDPSSTPSPAPVPAPAAQVVEPSGSTSNKPYEMGFWNYVGVNVGQSHYRADCPSVTGCTDDGVGFKIHTGGMFNRFLGLEVGYVNLGRPETEGGRQQAQGANLSLVGSIPVGNLLAVNGRVGTMYGWTSTTGAVPAAYEGREQGFGLSYGAGVAVPVANNLQLRVDWDRYDLNFRGRDGKVDMVSAGVQYLF